MIIEDMTVGQVAAELGLPGNSAGFGRFAYAETIRRTHPELDLWICRRILAGMRPRAVVAATDGAITLRTAYRWVNSLLGVEEVVVGGYRSHYALRRGQPPTRITEWERSPQ